MKDFANRLCLVTGAGSGIGRALAFAFARAQARVLLVDVNEENLARSSEQVRALGAVAQSYRCDVADWAAVQGLAEQVHNEHGPLDVLCNNAGVALAGSFLDTSIEDWQWINGINVMGVVHGCKAFLPAMQAHGGHVLNTASSAGLNAPSFLAAYATTKFAVVGLSESLRGEMAHQGIGVSALCPGFVHTGIVTRSRMVGDQPADAAAKADRFYAKRNLSADTVAEAALEGIRRNQAVISVGLETHAAHLTKRFLPAGWDRLNRQDLRKTLDGGGMSGFIKNFTGG